MRKRFLLLPRTWLLKALSVKKNTMMLWCLMIPHQQLPTEATVSTLSTTSATMGSKQSKGWPSGSVATYIKCPNKPSIPTKVPYDQSCCFCDYKQQAATFPSTHWATHIFNCNAALIEVWIAIGKQCKGKDLNDKLMNELVCQKHSQDIMSVPCLGRTEMIPPPKRCMVMENTLHMYSDYCNDQWAKHINMQVTHFITGCALPFLIIQSTFFIDMLQSLNSVYVDQYLVKADAFTQTWLPKLCIAVRQQMNSLWKENSGSLCTIRLDGFTNEIQDKVLFSVSQFGILFYLKVWLHRKILELLRTIWVN